MTVTVADALACCPPGIASKRGVSALEDLRKASSAGITILRTGPEVYSLRATGDAEAVQKAKGLVSEVRTLRRLLLPLAPGGEADPCLVGQLLRSHGDGQSAPVWDGDVPSPIVVLSANVESLGASPAQGTTTVGHAGANTTAAVAPPATADVCSKTIPLSSRQAFYRPSLCSASLLPAVRSPAC